MSHDGVFNYSIISDHVYVSYSHTVNNTEWMSGYSIFCPSSLRTMFLCLLTQPKPCSKGKINNFSLGFSKEHLNVIYECLPNINQLLFPLQNGKVVHFPFYRQGAEAQKEGQKCLLIFRTRFDMPWTWLFTVLSIIHYFIHSTYCSFCIKWLLVVLCSFAYQICRIISQENRRWAAYKQWPPGNVPWRDCPPRNTEAPFSQAALQHLDFGTIQVVIHHTIPGCCTGRERNLADNNHITRRTVIVHTDISPIYKTRQWSKGKQLMDLQLKVSIPLQMYRGAASWASWCWYILHSLESYSKKSFGLSLQICIKTSSIFPEGMSWCAVYKTVKRDTVLRSLSNCVPGLVPVPIEKRPCVRRCVSSRVLKTSRDEDFPLLPLH